MILIQIKNELLILKKSLNEDIEIKYIKNEYKCKIKVMNLYLKIYKDHWLQIKIYQMNNMLMYSLENNVNLKDFILDINKQIALSF